MKRGLALGQRGHRENDGDIDPNMANGWETIQYTFVASNATMGAPIQNIPLLWGQSKGMAVLRAALGPSTQDIARVVQRSSSALASMVQSLVG
jgi:hypothetical protein